MKSPILSPLTTRPSAHHSIAIEKLEARIAPAVLVGAKTLTYTDIDGDLVTLTISKGTLTAADFAFDGEFGLDTPQQLRLIDFAGDKDKAGADISITAEAAGGGDGSVNIGYLNATGIDLGKVTTDGDLGRIDAGDANLKTPGAKRIEVGSMGVAGLTTQAQGGNLISHIAGPLNALAVTGDLDAATLLVTGAITSIDIGGNITGGADAQSGSIRASGSIGTAHVVLNINGGDGEESGQIYATRNIGSITVDGSIIGSDTENAAKNGRVFAGRTIDLVVLGHELIGGVAEKSGQISSGTGLGSVQIAGSVQGGSGLESGAVGSGGPISSIEITHDLIGFQGASTPTGDSNGSILGGSKISRIVIGGDIRGGDNLHSGVIATVGGLGKVTVQGSVIGGNGEESGAIGSNGAIGSVKIVEDLEGRNGDQSGRVVSKKSIGSVLVQGSVFGGFGNESGAIGALGVVKSVRIEGSLIGGDGSRSGLITSEKKITSATVVGALGFSSRAKIVAAAVAETNGRSVEFFGSGLIAAPVINRVTVGTIGSQESFDPGSIQGGVIGTINVTDTIFSGFFRSAYIAARSIGSITVAHDVVGRGTSGFGGSPVEIDVRDSLGSLTIGGNANYLSVIAGGGFDRVEQPTNPDAQVGKIKVTGNWVESTVAVGTFSGEDGRFGTIDDEITNGGSPAILGTIARIQIGGIISSGPSQTGQPFGFLAQHIVALDVEGDAIPLKAGARNDSKFLNFSAQVFVRENNETIFNP